MNTRIQSVLSLALLCIALPGHAGNAYTWTDSNGVTHFSESVPANVVEDAKRVDLKSVPVVPGMAPERYRSISNQAARMKVDRLKREQARLKRRQIEARRYQDRIDAYKEEQDERVTEHYFYPYPLWYRPHSGQHYPRHPRPHHRPYPHSSNEFKAGKTITQKQNAEALRGHQRRW